jgi:hypothetical protein
MKKLLIIPLVVSLFSARAQDQPEMRKDNEQPRVITYHAEEPKKQVNFETLNLVKMNVISALAGDIGLSYERQIAGKFSGEAGLGVTVKNFSQGMLVNFMELKEGYFDPKISRQYGLGPSFMIAAKYYPSGAMDEFYFAPEFKFKKYNSSATVQNQRGTFEEHLTLSDFKLTVGYLDYIEDNIILEYNVGLGVRQRNQSMLKYVENDNSGNPVNKFQVEPVNTPAPLVSFGIKIGFVAKK